MIKGKTEGRTAGTNATNNQPTPESPMNGGYGDENSKLDDLAKNKEDSAGEFLTTNQGVRVNDNQNSLKAGDRGPTLLEDFILREKITHFDHERIPERVVHARGSAAHGYFQVYESMAQYTKADFLQDPS
ncbi:MAG TPA: catalase, partial [Pyrinomonadaceae bacterium]|nr:catalase [Pyrinomonadaceae bacterium]